ncbi:MAG: alpha/beta hydrolase [Burkholderiales bacterium]|nr:alpha/beta hydrolase [Burkholderiales bacterium]
MTNASTTPASANPDQAFSALSPADRARMLALGPVWARDIGGNRDQVLKAYMPILAATPREGLTVARDLAYGNHARQRLDVYSRTGLKDAPVVVFIHGGAFVRGDKDSNPEVYANFLRYFSRHGIVGVNVEYRLAPESVYPGGAEDVGAAVAWVRANIAAHGGDPSRIVLIGHSAGGSHAGAYACDPAVVPRAGHGLAGLVLISSRLRVDVLPGNPNAGAVRIYYGENEAHYEERSVVTHAARLDIPVFLAAAEFENPYLDAYTAEFAARVAMARGKMPRFLHLRGHNHASIVAHFDSGEEMLGRELVEFVRNPR